MSNLQNWFNYVAVQIVNGIQSSGSNIINSIVDNSIDKYMLTHRNPYPSTDTIGIDTGRLVRAMRTPKDIIVQGQNTLIYTRVIDTPYSVISNEGGNIRPTMSMIKAMFANLKKTGRYNPNIKRGKQHKGGIIFRHKPFRFLDKAVAHYTSDMLLRDTQEQILLALEKIPNIEVQIGN